MVVNWLAAVLAALAFFAVGAVWYGGLFSRAWQAETGITEPPKGAAVARTMGLTLLAELLVCVVLGHIYAGLGTIGHDKLTIAVGLGALVMAPALAINYLHQRKSLKLFAIDAGHFVVGTAAAGGVFALLD